MYVVHETVKCSTPQLGMCLWLKLSIIPTQLPLMLVLGVVGCNIDRHIIVIVITTLYTIGRIQEKRSDINIPGAWDFSVVVV